MKFRLGLDGGVLDPCPELFGDLPVEISSTKTLCNLTTTSNFSLHLLPIAFLLELLIVTKPMIDYKTALAISFGHPS